MVWTLFDSEFNLVKSSSGMLRVSNVANITQTLSQLNISMDRGGYFYAYLANESPMNVYFDDFQVVHTTGQVLEENHYYPFGMLNGESGQTDHLIPEQIDHLQTGLNSEITATQKNIVQPKP